VEQAYGILLSGDEDQEITTFHPVCIPIEGLVQEVLSALDQADDGLVEQQLNLSEDKLTKF